MPRKNKIAKHQRLSINKFDCNKKRYQNARQAQDAAELQMLEDMNLNLSVYKCNLCQYWHLTRQNNQH